VFSIRLFIRDTGTGIPEKELTSIFERFHTLERYVPGTGLGLAITKKLVGFLDGEIGVNSTVGEGSEFWVVLNMKLGEHKCLAKNRNNDLAKENASILLVDDDQLNIYTTKEILMSYGFHVDSTHRSTEVLKLVSTHKYDVVILDFQMPGKTGLEVAKDLSLNKFEVATIIYTAQTTFLNSFYETRPVGIDNVLLKPALPEELYMAVNNVLLKHKPKKQIVNPADFKLKQLFDVINDKDRLTKMLNLYDQQLNEIFVELTIGFQNKNSEYIRSLIHKLKSSVKMFGDEQLLFSVNELSRISHYGHWDESENQLDHFNKAKNSSIFNLKKIINNLESKDPITLN
jgi:CheY-like chemotaxis protein